MYVVVGLVLAVTPVEFLCNVIFLYLPDLFLKDYPRTGHARLGTLYAAAPRAPQTRHGGHSVRY